MSLDSLKSLTTIVADTANFELIDQYKPQDSTTNPSLILQATGIEQYNGLIEKALQKGRDTTGSLDEKVEVVLDNLCVAFGCEILKLVPGRVSTEVDAKYSYDTVKTIQKAHQLCALYRENGVDPSSRVLIKIASTWEGIKAAEQLEKEGIHCNLTLLFGFGQAVACAEAGVTLISPFVGRILDWYKKKEGKDGYPPSEDPGVISVQRIYNYYKKYGYNTIVMGASFRNKDEITELAGIDYLTISPKLLEELKSSSDAVPSKLSVETAKTKCTDPKISLDETQFRWMLSEDAMATEKLAEGIRNFSKDTRKVEEVIKEKLQADKTAQATTTVNSDNTLEALKQATTVVADTADFALIEQYQPQDTTTNPSLILQAFNKEEYKGIIDAALDSVKNVGTSVGEKIDAAMDALAVRFGVEVLKKVPGRVSTEVDAKYSYNTAKTIEKARELCDLYRQQGVDPSKRVLIKIASTWEGIAAAKQLEQEGIHCNLTLLFGFAQAVACAEANVTLISPFVGRIMDWYKAAEGREFAPEEDPGVKSVSRIYNYYKKYGYKTIVMGASFRNTGEIEQLAGCDYLTISPKLLEQLKSNKASLDVKLSVEKAQTACQDAQIHVDEDTFRWMMNEDPMATEKLAEGIRNFSKDSRKVECALAARFGAEGI